VIRSIDLACWSASFLLATSLLSSVAAYAVPAKYELVTSDTKVEDGHKLTRVRRLSDGALGGYIESENNLSQSGASFLDEHSRAYGQARILDDAQLHGLARDSGRLSGRAALYGAISDNGQVKDDAVVHGKVYGNAVVEGHAVVNGQAYGNAKVEGQAQVYGTVSGNAVVSGDEAVYGDRQ
jgi:hypothetical protein